MIALNRVLNSFSLNSRNSLGWSKCHGNALGWCCLSLRFLCFGGFVSFSAPPRRSLSWRVVDNLILTSTSLNPLGMWHVLRIVSSFKPFLPSNPT